MTEPPVRGAQKTPYQNLWVPLVVVPAGIVIAIVLVFALFGALSGSERSLDENLELVVNGGENERDQALFALTQQAVENQRALDEGREPPWAMGREFLARVRAGVDELDDDDHRARLALAILLAIHDDPRGGEMLIGALALSPEQDPQGEIRFAALQNLALLGDPVATEPVAALLSSDDEGLRTLAAAALGRFGGEKARERLRTALDDPSLGVRGSAALSLTKLSPPDPAAAEVLRELLDPAVYADAHAEDADKYRRADLVRDNRVRALRALATLERAEDRPLFEELAEDPDVAVSEAAMEALRGGGGG